MSALMQLAKHKAYENTGLNLEFFTVTTVTATCDMVGTSAAEVAARDLLVQVVNQKTQPQIMGDAYADSTNSVIKFACTAGVWTAADLKTALIAAATANVNGTTVAFDNTMTVTKSDTLV